MSPAALPARAVLQAERLRRDLPLTAAEAVREPGNFDTYFPDTGPLRRELYPKSLQFFAAGVRYRERLFLAANRSGKTVTAAYEVTAHVTGLYPAWWPGRVLPDPSDCWAAGDTRETTRDIIQNELFGPRGDIRRGTYSGMVPGHLVLDRTLMPGVADCLDTVWIQHTREKQHGGPMTSTIQFKSYVQGRMAFQGTTKKIIWLDEEPPEGESAETTTGGVPSGNGDIYTECLLRTATNEGMIISTFTPLRGLTPFIDHYLETSELADATGRIVNAKLGLFGETIE
jgi:phage terminase large subunit-like protein